MFALAFPFSVSYLPPDKSHAGDKAVEITSMATLDAAPQFGAELKVLFVRDNYCWSMLTSW